jgi:CRISPR-associated protein Cmr1
MSGSDSMRIYEFTALSDLWTGGVNSSNGKRTINTGLLGSIRWWYEVLARGLGGRACDPSNTKCNEKRHCVVCELFGCTGWARKFRFQILDKEGNIQDAQITKGKSFNFEFTPLRPIYTEEWALLTATLRLISDFGAIGGKTVLKPSDQNNKSAHADYGLIKFVSNVNDNVSEERIREYVRNNAYLKPDQSEFDWASLDCFWFVHGKFLSRQSQHKSTYNRIIGRPEIKRDSAKNDSWIAGYNASHQKGPQSKKVFSFSDPSRTYGFFSEKEGVTFEVVKERLENVWDNSGWKMLVFDDIVRNLFCDKEPCV